MKLLKHIKVGYLNIYAAGNVDTTNFRPEGFFFLCHTGMLRMLYWLGTNIRARNLLRKDTSVSKKRDSVLDEVIPQVLNCKNPL